MVSGLADSALFVRLTRGRMWIAILAALLVGIVALNVVALSLTSSSSRAAVAADQLEQSNSALRGQIARTLSTEEIQDEANRLGLATPPPGEIGYLKASPDDAAIAAKRLRAGELTLGSAAPSAPVEVVDSTLPATPVGEPAAPAPETSAPVAPAEITPAQTAPAETAPAEAPPATDPAATAPSTAGGVTAP